MRIPTMYGSDYIYLARLRLQSTSRDRVREHALEYKATTRGSERKYKTIEYYKNLRYDINEG